MTREELVQSVLVEAGDRFAVAPERILAQDRHKSVVSARRFAMQILRERFDWSYPEIGKAMKRDHSTVMQALKADYRERHNLQVKLAKLRVA